MRCRKKPIVVDSWQWTNKIPYDKIDISRHRIEDIVDNPPKWVVDAYLIDIIQFYFDTGILKVKTLEGDHTGTANDYLMRGVQGELYICREDIYKATYDELEGEV